jgi:hypothetical protein
MKKMLSWFLCAALAAAAGGAAQAGMMLVPLTSFGGGDGWLAPGELGFNSQTNATVRGITYNPANNRLYVVDRHSSLAVKILDGDTGAQVGTLDVTGVTGGTFALSMIDVDDQGVIYAANLSTSATSNFKVYRWATESSAPTVAFDGLANRARTGDSFAVTGSGASTKMAAAGGSTAGQDFAFFTTADGASYSVANPVATGAATGAFRLGIDIDAGTVVGLQAIGSGGSKFTSAPEAGGSASIVTLTSGGEAPLAWDASLNLLATADHNSSLVRLYDTSSASFALLDAKNLTTAFVSNGNGVGDLKFGRPATGPLRLYALNANNGIQAFAVVPEPAGALLVSGAALALLASRRRQS